MEMNIWAPGFVGQRHKGECHMLEKKSGSDRRGISTGCNWYGGSHSDWGGFIYETALGGAMTSKGSVKFFVVSKVGDSKWKEKNSATCRSAGGDWGGSTHRSKSSKDPEGVRSIGCF